MTLTLKAVLLVRALSGEGASLAADMIDQRKHLALHRRCMASTRHSGSRAAEQLMDMQPQSPIKHHF